MKRQTAVVLLILLIFSFCCAGCRAASIPSAAIEEFDRAVTGLPIPALELLIVNPTGVVVQKSYGTAGPDAPFLLGSLSKSFTALCIMQLEESGALSLDAPVSDYLADAPEGVTIRELLNQTGGIDTYQVPDDPDPHEKSGTHIYSNLNYALLGRVIEEVSGITYEEYLQRNVLAPLGMTASSSTAEGSLANGLVQGYESWFGWPVPAAPHFPDDLSWIQPSAGYISASAADMGRYLQMYLQGGEDLLSEEAVGRMFSENVYVEGDLPYYYGMGWTVNEGNLPETVYRHTGLVETGMTCMFLLPERGLGIVLLADMTDYLVGTDLLDRIGWNLVLNIMGEEAIDPVGPGEYWRMHQLYNLAYAAVLGLALASLLTAFRPRASLCRSRDVLFPLFLLGAAIFLLLLPRLLTGAPLWVAAAFVPDLFTVIVISSGLLLAAGLTRLIRRRGSKGTPA